MGKYIEHTMDNCPWEVRWHHLESGNFYLSNYTRDKMKEIVRKYPDYFTYNNTYQKRKILNNKSNEKNRI